MADPGKYFHNNVSGGLNLLRSMVECGVKRIVFSSSCATFGTPERVMRLRSVHPGVEAGDVVAATGFPLTIPDEVPVTRLPTATELELIRTRLDPDGEREREIP